MKIIEEGKKEAKMWWVGVKLTCRNCKRSVELEQSDENSPALTLSPYSVAYRCETCGVDVYMDNPANEQLVNENTKVTEPAKTEEPTKPSPQPVTENPNAARVGNKVTQGYSDPFAGTSWGVNK